MKFFCDWGWLVTSLEATLFRYESILGNLDWQEFKDKYFVDGRNAFDHFVSLFIGLVKPEKPVVKAIIGDYVAVNQLTLTKSSWANEAFTVWVYLWPKAVQSLPECCNDYKSKVMKQATMLL